VRVSRFNPWLVEISVTFNKEFIMKQDIQETGTGIKTGRRSESGQGQHSEADKQEMMKKAEAAGAPGPNHKALEHFVGNWKCDVKCWMDPNGEPNRSNGTARVEWIMNGRFLQEEFKGQMMEKAFNGRTVLGYNNVKQVYQLTWIDDMNTATFYCEGRGDAKTITLEGKSSCPATGRTDIPMKVVYRVQGPNQHVFEMFDGSQDNAKTMEITYTRQ
jgi:hypothetical protein